MFECFELNGKDSPAPATLETPLHSGSKGCERAFVFPIYSSILARYAELVDRENAALSIFPSESSCGGSGTVLPRRAPELPAELRKQLVTEKGVPRNLCETFIGFATTSNEKTPKINPRSHKRNTYQRSTIL